MTAQDSQGSVPIVGAWRLLSFEIQTSDGRTIYPYGEDALGSIIYTEARRFSAQVMRCGRPQLAAGDQMKGSPEEIKANYEGFISYFGPYDFNPEQGYVIHHVEGSLFPNWEGDAQKRFFELDGNHLKLSTPPTQWGGGGEIVGKLVWERITG